MSQRPSHEFVMQAQDALGEARNAEQAAGNFGVAMVLNDLVLSLFQIALNDEFDDLANAAYEKRYGQPTTPTGSTAKGS